MAVHWDSRELVVLACDAVMGWHAMRGFVASIPDFFIVDGVRFGRGIVRYRGMEIQL